MADQALEKEIRSSTLGGGFLRAKGGGKRPLQAFEREIVLVLSLGLAVFYWTALGSFSPLDPSITTVVFPETAIKNLAGSLGAHLASGTIYLFGLVAYLLPIPLLVTAIALVRQRSHPIAPTRLLAWGLLMGCLLTTGARYVPHVSIAGFELPSGGIFGQTMAQALHTTMGSQGSVIILITVAFMALLWLLRQPLIKPALESLPIPTWTLPRWRLLHRQKQTEESSARRESAPDEPQVLPTWGPTPDIARDQTPLTLEEPSIAGDGSVPVIKTDPVLPLVATPRLTEIAPGDHDETEPKEDQFAEESNRLDTVTAVTPSSIPHPYTPPPLSVFHQAPLSSRPLAPKECAETSALLVKTFEDFGIRGQIVGYQPGPVVTVYEFQPEAGIKQSKVIGLIDDLALALKVDSIFIHPVRGKSALGVQVPNTQREPVYLGDVLGSSAFKDARSPLTFGLGKTITGQPMCTDLAAMPHLLVAGATGSGKSVGINAMLSSIIMKAKPEDVRMILVDPKMLELSVYEGIPHLLMPVITEPTKASLALKWAASEMERRYRLMQLACVRHIEGFNEFWAKASDDKKAEIKGAAGCDRLDRLPYILLVIDELADLMMTAPKDVEGHIQRLAQKARASGIHMVLATQRPSVDIITGVIKANLPSRIAYQVVSKHDSRTILDLIGAEKLLGKGDLLFQRPGIGRLERLQGALITDEEVLNLVASVKSQTKVQYDEDIISWIDDEYHRQKDASGANDDSALKSPEDEPKFHEALAIARNQGAVSASFLQRQLKIGYNRAARIVEFMELQGLVDKADGSKPRKWKGRDLGQ